MYKSHAESIGLDNLHIRLHPIAPSPIHCILKSDETGIYKSEFPTITDMYNITSLQKLEVLRETMQSTLVPESDVGSSSSSKHLVSVLRLVELHRRGLTQLSFHAIGIRKVDIETKMSRIIGIAPSSPSRQVKLCNFSQEKFVSPHNTVTVKPNNTSTTSEINHSTVDSIQCLKLIKGLVSNEVFLDPVLAKLKLHRGVQSNTM
ncbi:unnamed protein product [Heterobilharzia americana]|nr:unnamed protein product [Heterobilharzia americana]